MARYGGVLERVRDQLRMSSPGAAILALPVILLLLSLVLQPMIVARYIIVVPIGLAVLTTALVECVELRLPSLVYTVAVASLAGVFVWTGHAIAILNEPQDRTSIAVQEAVDSLQAGGHSRILFARRFELYPAIESRPQRSGALSLLDFEGRPKGVTDLTLFERDMARRVSLEYPRYRLTHAESVEGNENTVIISLDPGQLSLILGGRQIEPLAFGVYRVAPRATSANPQ